jgi:hypothetical protein
MSILPGSMLRLQLMEPQLNVESRKVLMESTSQATQIMQLQERERLNSKRVSAL